MFSTIYKILLIVYSCLFLCLAPAYATGMGDPLRPPEYAPNYPRHNVRAQTKPGWRVNEILFSGGRRVAIVNNVAVAVGDSVNGARVVDIKPAHVVLKYKKSFINSRLHTVRVKKTRLNKKIDLR